MSPAEHHKPAHARGANHGGSKSRRGRNRLIVVVTVIAVAAGASVGVVLTMRARHPAPHRVARTTTTTTAPTTTVPPTTTTQPASSTGLSATPCTPGPVTGSVYAVGDSVMIDYQQLLQACVPGIQVNAAVSRQWSDGETVMRSVMAGPSPPSVVVVGLGTNGPITAADFTTMMSILHGATRVVFVTGHVDRAWEEPNNAILASGVAQYRKVAVLADWQSLAAQHPEWFYSDGTHLPIDGPGAQALAALIAAEV
jgi:hypothetical protein